ncbi:ALG6 [Cordylochernes scorpioides]|uniref:Alpha-1,3-glucosyltransferase n=1 Tax=Cordylochernes scorpioides TaxID=51811 RepID=A0ABY6KBL5_9ARAC|nr:ALG6 [Cordylochernes scorpioides]
MNKPPMFGDFEAQRHWMEITYHLPVAEWYRQSPNNNLQYWGLDYPPLTAFHSLLMGALSHQLSPRWVALNESRGIAITEHKLFMRNTVVFADLLIFIPAVLLFWHRAQRPTSLRDKAVAAVVCLLYPGLILIDHGHFQYNCISLGLCLWGIVLLREGYCHWASLLYTLALNYKQMELYHAPPFFFYLLGRVWLQHHNTRSRITAVVKLGAVVLGTTAFIWLPFMVPPASPLDVVQRLFPLARGLYEYTWYKPW